jgi:hypothetical protein
LTDRSAPSAVAGATEPPRSTVSTRVVVLDGSFLYAGAYRGLLAFEGYRTTTLPDRANDLATVLGRAPDLVVFNLRCGGDLRAQGAQVADGFAVTHDLLAAALAAASRCAERPPPASRPAERRSHANRVGLAAAAGTTRPRSGPRTRLRLRVVGVRAPCASPIDTDHCTVDVRSDRRVAVVHAEPRSVVGSYPTSLVIWSMQTVVARMMRSFWPGATSTP